MKLAIKLVSLVVISALAGCGESETATTYLAKAKSFQSTQVDEKLIALKNAIKLEPDNVEARFLLGETYLNQGFATGAIKELEKAYEFIYNKNKLVPLLARAYILTSSDESVLDLSNNVNSLSNEAAVHYLAYKTLAEIRLGNLDNAKSSVEQANILSPDDAYSLLAQAYLDMADGNLYNAENNAQKLLNIMPEQKDAVLLLGQVNTALNNHSEATTYYTQYAQLQPKSSIIVMFLAQSLLKEEKYQEAEKYADTILASVPNQPFANYIKAMAQFSLKNYSEAQERAEVALKANFNQASLKLVAGISAYFTENYEQSHHHLEPIVQYLTPQHPARKMYALSQLQLGMLDDISNTLEGFNASTVEDNKFLSTLSYQMAELGAVDKAKIIAQKSTNKLPADADQNMREGILKLMLNDPSGMDDLKSAVKLNPDMLGAELALAYAAIKSGDYKQAIDIADKWKIKHPKKIGGYNVLAAVYLKQGEIDAAKKEMHESLKVSPKNLFALLELTNLAMIEGDKKEAEKLSEFAAKEFPLNTKVLKQYYSIRRDEAAFNKIKNLYLSDTKGLPVALLYAELLINAGDYNEATNILDTFENNVKSPKEMWLLKVAAQKSAGNNNKALLLLEEWTKTNPYHIEPIVMLSDYYGRMKDEQKALNIIESALGSAHSNNVMLKLGKMQLLLDMGNVYRSKEYFKVLKTQNIAETISQGIEGKIALLDKDYIKASKLLSKFYNANPLSKNALLLNEALQRSNRSQSAIELLEFHLEKNEKDNNVRLALANNYLNIEPQKAILAYKRILEDHPNSVMVLNNVAWLSMEAGNIEEAITFSESAFKLAPDDVNVIDTKAMILFKAGRKGEALRHLGTAHDLSKGKNSSVALNYAEVLIASKRKQSAIKILNTISTNNDSERNRLKELMILAN